MISSSIAAWRTPWSNTMKLHPSALSVIRRQYRKLRRLGMANHEARSFIFDLLFDGQYLARFVAGQTTPAEVAS